MTNTNAAQGGYASKRKAANVAVYIILSVMSVIWIFPIFWLLMQSFRGEKGAIVPYVFPKQWTFSNYTRLFNDPDITEAFPYGKWFLNTLIVAIFSCLISTFIVLMVSYAFSRLRFKSRKTFLNLGLILGMFPGFMSMAATYNIMKAFHIEGTLGALVIVYSAGAGLGYQVAKGYFDTVSRSLDEAAMIDGATRSQIFYKIILPLSKPIIVYTALTTFIGPWTDYIFVSYFMLDDKENYTVAAGLVQLTNATTMYDYFTLFCAGAVLVAIPITILFVIMQKFYVAGVTGGAVKG
ncbi:MAG: sugar ABC transporter permease [Clostridia bacterium]|nr:sugar ABC transporter permease [Clostridia bacterium]